MFGDTSDFTDIDVVATALSRASERFASSARSAQYRYDPYLWAKDRLGMHLWSMQQEISESVVNNKKTAVKSCHDSGKTFLAAVICCWWIDTRPQDETMVISTAPTAYQVNKLLWEYIRRLHRIHNLAGTVSEASEWKGDDRQVIGMGRKPADTNIHGFQGIHRKYVLVVIDECCGVPQQIWTGVEAITTNPDNRVLAIGNPDEGATEFGRIYRDDDPSWEKFTISAFDTPNFTDEGATLPEGMAELLLERKWVEEKEISWGVDSARYKSKVLAEFPDESADSFFTPLTLQLGLTNTELLRQEISTEDRPVMGVDIARFGGDSTVCILNEGGALSIAGHWDKTDTMTSAQKIHTLAVALGVSEVRIDATGIGVGVADRLTQLCFSFYVVIEMVGSASSPDPTRWFNHRAYIYDYLREGLLTGTLGLPAITAKDDPEKQLYEELEGVRYSFMPTQGSIVMEKKDAMRARGVKSPDFADAATYAAAPIDINDPSLGMGLNEVEIYDPMDQYEDQGYVLAPW